MLAFSGDEIVFTTNETSIDVSGLLPFYQYAVAVKAITQVGAGPWSEWVPVRTLEDSKSLLVMVFFSLFLSKKIEFIYGFQSPSTDQ